MEMSIPEKKESGNKRHHQKNPSKNNHCFIYSDEQIASMENILPKKKVENSEKLLHSKIKTQSGSNSKNNFNIFERFDTDYEANEDKNCRKSSMKDENHIPSKLTDFIMGLDSSRRMIHLSQQSKVKDGIKCKTPNLQQTSQDCSPDKEFLGKDDTKFSKKTYISRHSSKNNSIHFKSIEMNLEIITDKSDSAKNCKSQKSSHKKKLNVKSCAFSLSDLSKDSSVSNYRAKEKSSKFDLSEFSGKSNKNHSEIMRKNQQNEEISSNLGPATPQETFVKVAKFIPHQPKKPSNLKLNISRDHQKHFNLSGNTYNVHYNTIYNGDKPTQPQTPFGHNQFHRNAYNPSYPPRHQVPQYPQQYPPQYNTQYPPFMYPQYPRKL